MNSNALLTTPLYAGAGAMVLSIATGHGDRLAVPAAYCGFARLEIEAMGAAVGAQEKPPAPKPLPHMCFKHHSHRFHLTAVRESTF